MARAAGRGGSEQRRQGADGNLAEVRRDRREVSGAGGGEGAGGIGVGDAVQFSLSTIYHLLQFIHGGDIALDSLMDNGCGDAGGVLHDRIRDTKVGHVKAACCFFHTDLRLGDRFRPLLHGLFFPAGLLRGGGALLSGSGAGLGIKAGVLPLFQILQLSRRLSDGEGPPFVGCEQEYARRRRRGAGPLREV